MAISFEYIPANTLLPLFYAEVTSAREPFAANLKLCLIGYMNKGTASPGTAIENTLYLLSGSSVSSLFGRGSMLDMMYQKARANAPMAEIWGIAIAEEVGAIKATGTLTVTRDATNTLNGAARMWIAGRPIGWSIKPLATAAEIASTLHAAINRTVLPVTAAVTDDTITLTCRWAGLTGNEISISFCGPRGRAEAGEPAVRLAKTFVDVEPMSGGVLEAHPAQTFAAIGNRPFDLFAFPFTNVPNLDACADFMDGSAGRWSPFQQLYGHMVTTKEGAFQTIYDLVSARNDPHMTILGIMRTMNPSWEWTAALAGVMISHWAAPPELSRPLQTLELRGLAVGTDDDETFDKVERQILLEAGVTTFHVDPDYTCRIDRVRTTRKYNLFGDPDPSWADAITMFQAQYFVRQMRQMITSTYPRAALSNFPTGINGFVSPLEIRMSILSEYRRMQSLGLVDINCSRNTWLSRGML
jgi:phage tail sheath gpL-like